MNPVQSASLAQLRGAIRSAALRDEGRSVQYLVKEAKGTLGQAARREALERARSLVERCRAAGHRTGTLDAFLLEFGLANDEGVTLLCLAEALLRIPDERTADALIAEKVRSGDWSAHIGHSHSLFVNVSVWGLMLTGRLVTPPADAQANPQAWLRRLASRLGEPVVRAAVAQAMRILGGQYVLGRTLGEALRRGRSLAEAPVSGFSYDMLGEAARTYADAERYFQAYADAIETLGQAEPSAPSGAAEGVSVKLSALHPRFEQRQRRRVLGELAPKLKALALQAKRHGLQFTLDAEEAARLELNLDLFEGLAQDPDLADWPGLGFVLQAYQKRAPSVADWLVALAARTGHRFAVRLVKGAYWDAEVKRAQELGLPDYPVFTRKAHTDLCYEVCAARLLAAPEAIFPQFATHNAHTLSTILQLAQQGADFEFQRLHGMGQLLYAELREAVRLRVYAPVGSHRDLLPYLVRRLLENGANSSFVNRFLDREAPVHELVRDPLQSAVAEGGTRHPKIPAPPNLYRHAGEERANAKGCDLDDPAELDALVSVMGEASQRPHRAGPIVGGALRQAEGIPVFNPADRRRRLGTVAPSTDSDIEAALERAATAHPAWDDRGGAERAAVLTRAADLLESRCAALMGLIVAEAGRTVADALAEVREAVDFCRYYGLQAKQGFDRPKELPGPTGEANQLSLHGRGTFLCISPWNFPLAIFTGQAAAALAAGNSVVAKPAEQTGLVAAAATRLLHEAGVPENALHLLPGDGRVGDTLVGDLRVAGVAFTGSTATARTINRRLAERTGPITPLIAETGGQNAMLVDTTALPEQVVDDVIASAFHSAGQRCSALRILCLQEEIADDVLRMLAGAMQALIIGDPSDPATDVGPVIDARAVEALEAHVAALDRGARRIAACELPADCRHGTFFAPCAFEIDAVGELQEEVFGPVLHVVRYPRSNLGALIEDINRTGYGLTLGVHSRMDGFADEAFAKALAGNVYVNRNMVGAVVGVNPFGGRGLSGTGPQAGGPHYLLRFAAERTRTDNLAAKGGNADLMNL
ncbi:MAG: bifunctional proline dehydrogenase/L-glutamate gamma-semialdehyde dehydrogenase PutA [Gammaproteobacteria bacterium]|nr:bifunctional proline dehydrogenase/L-glutamate gamma-semialdehyde dehydrogenase PutA [Gammaproteobacteria bacterium]